MHTQEGGAHGGAYVAKAKAVEVADPDPALHARRHEPHRLLKRGHHVALVILEAPVARQRQAAAPARSTFKRMSHLHLSYLLVASSPGY